MKKFILSIFTFAILSSSALASERNTHQLRCAGTEPFWSLEVKGSAVTFKDPIEFKGSGFFDAQITEAVGMAPGFAFQIKASRKKGKEKLVLSVIHAGEQGCSDGMSEENWTYSVLADVNGVLYTGCCGERQ